MATGNTAAASARRSRPPRKWSARPGVTPGPVRHEEYVRRVHEALSAEYFALAQSPLAELPGVVALARSEYARKIYPTASALRALLGRALDLAMAEVEGSDEKRLQQVATCLRLIRQHASIPHITEQLGLHSQSYVRMRIRRQALELVTDAFLQLARKTDEKTDDKSNETSGMDLHPTIEVRRRLGTEQR